VVDGLESRRDGLVAFSLLVLVDDASQDNDQLILMIPLFSDAKASCVLQVSMQKNREKSPVTSSNG
jgi:hypothetical protein